MGGRLGGRDPLGKEPYSGWSCRKSILKNGFNIQQQSLCRILELTATLTDDYMTLALAECDAQKPTAPGTGGGW